MWNNLGQPDPPRLNQASADLEARKLALAQSDPRVHYVQALGLMQYIFGYPQELPVAPGGSFPPGMVAFPGRERDDYQPFPGGDLNYPSPPIAFAFEGADPIHLNDFAYRVLATHQMMEYFFPKFRGQPDQSFRSQGQGFDGSVQADGSTHSEFVTVGDEGLDNAYRGILSFDTSSLPDGAAITKASIYLGRVVDCCGSNPFASGALGRPQADVVRGSFGEPTLQPADFEAAATVVDAGVFIGQVLEPAHRLRIDLNAAGLAAINTAGLTQVRLYFPNTDADADHVSFNSGDAAAFDPVLDVFYGANGFGGAAAEADFGDLIPRVALTANSLIVFLCIVTGLVIGLAVLAVWLSARRAGA
jgi:hypothetical protein